MSNSSGLTPMFSNDDLDQWFGIFQEKAEESIILLLKATGEKFVKYARELHTYEDQTGNLRSSIGYIIVHDGEMLLEDFKESDKGTEKAKGVSTARQLVENIALTYSQGMILIGVAGMQYAAAVEAKGYDVVTGACSQAEAHMRKAIQETIKKAS
ncbi:hypothetical protein [Bacteroides ihuae]|uniref:hypothetical protein n=1 Tax=Bacteroides ihuae TaxID=1852362 RepID=UPI00098EDCFE|nr:hypothetical protein [Bacteroides ihuae]